MVLSSPAKTDACTFMDAHALLYLIRLFSSVWNCLYSNSRNIFYEVPHYLLVPRHISALSYMWFTKNMSIWVDLPYTHTVKLFFWRVIPHCDALLVFVLSPYFPLCDGSLHTPFISFAFHWSSRSFRVPSFSCLRAVVGNCLLLTHWLRWQLLLVEALTVDSATWALSALDLVCVMFF